ncbi:MAG: RNA polymerase sigma factor [Polyangiales bacterium]
MGSSVVGKQVPGAEVGARDVDVLARLAAEGDTAAMTRLLRLLAPEMARVVRGVMGPYAADADDALQQSLVAVVQALPAFRGECAPQGYACRIAFRTALAVRKRAQVAHAHAREHGEAEPLVEDAGMSAESARRTRLLRTLLDALPPDQAEALALRTMLGWSLDEIAQVAGVPLNTVRSRMRLAKEALRARIEADPTLADELGVSS